MHKLPNRTAVSEQLPPKSTAGGLDFAHAGRCAYLWSLALEPYTKRAAGYVGFRPFGRGWGLGFWLIGWGTNHGRQTGGEVRGTGEQNGGCTYDRLWFGAAANDQVDVVL